MIGGTGAAEDGVGATAGNSERGDAAEGIGKGVGVTGKGGRGGGNVTEGIGKGLDVTGEGVVNCKGI